MCESKEIKCRAVTEQVQVQYLILSPEYHVSLDTCYFTVAVIMKLRQRCAVMFCREPDGAKSRTVVCLHSWACFLLALSQHPNFYLNCT